MTFAPLFALSESGLQ